MKRRDFLGWSSLSAILFPLKAIAAVWNKAAFEAIKVIVTKNEMYINNEIISDQIEIITPKKVENGAFVQVEVTSNIPNSEAIALIVEASSKTLIANVMFEKGVLAKFVTRIKMVGTSDIKIIVKSGAKYYTTSKNIEVLENGCGNGGSASEKFVSATKVWAKTEAELTQTSAARINGLVILKAIITHPMHTGYGKDDFGRIVPAHFIQVLKIQHNNNQAIEMHLGTGVSKDPHLTFYLTDGKPGDKINLVWQDNKGSVGQRAVKVTA